MAKAIRTGREHRCSNMQQLHVLEMMESFTTASREERVVTLETPYERGPIMDIHGMQGILGPIKMIFVLRHRSKRCRNIL